MGAIGGLLGLNGQAGGTGFQGPVQSDQQGMNNLQDSYQRLLQVAQGQGPNPAMQQYNQNINNIAKQQSGAISSVQGISPALAARMISQQGSGAMQNAAAQGATMQAQQQLGAMGQMGNIGAAQAGAANQMQGNINNVNMGFGTTTMQGQQGVIGGLFGGLGAAAAASGGGGGGAEGGIAGVDFAAPQPAIQNGADAFQFGQPSQPAPGPQSVVGKFMSGSDSAGSGAMAIQQGMTKFGEGMGTMMKAKPASPGMAMGGMASDYRSGGSVVAKNPSQKAVKPGNSYANDKIKAVLSEGEVVIPRAVMQSRDPVRATADFVAKVIAKRRGMAR